MSGNVSSDSLGGTATLLVGYRVTVTEVHAINTTASKGYVQLFDAATAGAVTLGTTVPFRVLTVPADDSADLLLPTEGLVFDNGVVAAATTTATGSTARTTHVRLGIR